MPSETAHESPVSGSTIIIPVPIYTSDGEFTDTDSFNSEFEYSSEDERKPTIINRDTSITNIQNQTLKQIIQSEEEDDDGNETSSESSSEENPKVNAAKIFKESLLQLEENITWEAVTEEFKEVRTGWRQSVRESSSASVAAALLVEFATYIRSEVMYDHEYIADEWTLQTTSENMTYNMLCGMLLALEETLNEDLNSFSSLWRDHVDAWRENLEEAECAGMDNFAGSNNEYYISPSNTYDFYEDF